MKVLTTTHVWKQVCKSTVIRCVLAICHDTQLTAIFVASSSLDQLEAAISERMLERDIHALNHYGSWHTGSEQ